MKTIKTVVHALIVVVSLANVVGARNPFSGDWRGTVMGVESIGEAPVRVVIRGDQANNYYCRDGVWRPSGVEPRSFIVRRNNALLTWIDEGGIWTETQVFSLSYVNHNTMAFIWARHVNNISEEANDDTWHLFGHGTLKRSADWLATCE